MPAGWLRFCHFSLRGSFHRSACCRRWPLSTRGVRPTHRLWPHSSSVLHRSHSHQSADVVAVRRGNGARARANLLHWLVSFALRVGANRLIWLARPAVSSHLKAPAPSGFVSRGGTGCHRFPPMRQKRRMDGAPGRCSLRFWKLRWCGLYSSPTLGTKTRTCQGWGTRHSLRFWKLRWCGLYSSPTLGTKTRTCQGWGTRHPATSKTPFLRNYGDLGTLADTNCELQRGGFSGPGHTGADVVGAGLFLPINRNRPCLY